MPEIRNPSPGPGAVSLLSTVTNLTSAQIKALSTTPVSLIPAPGAGKIVTVLGVALVYNFGTVAYGALAGDVLSFEYTGAHNDKVVVDLSNFVTAAASSFAYESGATSAIGNISPGDDNQAIRLISANDYVDGGITAAALGAAGLGYAANDTGFINAGDTNATYKILTVGAGGAVLTFQITAPGNLYSVANGQPTVDFGAQPGVGVGFTVNITAVQTGDGTLKVTTYYQIIPVP